MAATSGKSMFDNAHSPTVGTATQVNTQNYYDQSTTNITFNGGSQYVASGMYGRGESRMDKLHKKIVEDALHNSVTRRDAARCYPETRRAVQHEIVSWIIDDDEDVKKIMWITGPAGTGKTAIAGSVADLCYSMQILAGSYFFNSYEGGEERCTVRGLIPTLVYSFIQHEKLWALRDAVLSSIEDDPSIFGQELKNQCWTLLRKPFHQHSNRLDASSLPRVVIIDGLDEVEAQGSRKLKRLDARQKNTRDQEDILSAMLEAAEDPKFPFRIIIVSRPEPEIRKFFSSRASHVSKQLNLDSTYDPSSDIALYLRSKLAEIRQSYPSLPASWADEGVVTQLVENASRQFIYASVVIRFLQSDHTPPEERLKRILGLDPGRHTPNPFIQLDRLYRHILDGSPRPALAVKWISTMFYALSGYPAFFVVHLLQESDGQGDWLLKGLSSLISTQEIDRPFEVYHKSLIDYLGDAERCGEELHMSFMEPHFLQKQIVRILRDKGPKAPLNNAQLTPFLVLFFELFASDNSYDLLDAAKADDQIVSSLSEVDVGWWMDAAISTFSHRSSAGYCGKSREFVQLLWYFVPHQSQCVKPGLLHCIAPCKRGREGIINACRARGWSVPNEAFLLRETMYYAVSGSGVPSFGLPTSLFKPEPSQAPPSLSNRGYDVLLNLRDAMYHRLPTDWKARYNTDIHRKGVTRYDVLESCIRSIRRTLPAQIAAP